MSAIDELLIAVGIEQGSTLEELYLMLKDIQAAGGNIKIKFQEDLPTRGQVTNIYRRISELENKVLPQLNKFPELIDKVKEYIVDMYEGLKEDSVKDEVQRIEEIVRATLNKFPIYKREMTIDFNKISEEIREIFTKQKELPEDIVRTEIIKKIFQTEVPKGLPIITPEGKTAIDDLVDTLKDILLKKTPMEEGLMDWYTGPATSIGRSITPQQRTAIGKMFGVDIPSWKEGMEPILNIIEEKIKPFLEAEMKDPTSNVNQILIESVNKLNENIDFSHKILRQLRAGFQSTQKFENAISQQITKMDSRVKIIQDNVSKEGPEEKNLRKDKKGSLE